MKGRINFIDEYRGIAIIAMLLYHALYDMAVIFSCNMPWFFSEPMHIFQQWIGISFVLVSGMCCTLSKSNLKRGFITFGAALGMTAVTSVFMPSQIILFGVLHLLGFCSIIASAIMPAVKKLSRFSCLFLSAVCLILFAALYSVPDGFISVFSQKILLSDILYSSPVFFWLGFPSNTFYSADYYPLVPWMFLFLTGMFLSSSLKNRWPKFLFKSRIHFLSSIGRHTLIIYILHQPLIYAVLYIIFDVLR